uniref:Uncharacterized protein n=1 Tax=Aegilops tauschii TaxID=37682 RepID=M8CLQ8_AEGTA
MGEQGQHGLRGGHGGVEDDGGGGGSRVAELPGGARVMICDRKEEKESCGISYLR